MECPLKIHGKNFKIPINNQGFPDKIYIKVLLRITTFILQT